MAKTAPILTPGTGKVITLSNGASVAVTDYAFI